MQRLILAKLKPTVSSVTTLLFSGPRALAFQFFFKVWEALKQSKLTIKKKFIVIKKNALQAVCSILFSWQHWGKWAWHEESGFSYTSRKIMLMNRIVAQAPIKHWEKLNSYYCIVRSCYHLKEWWWWRWRPKASSRDLKITMNVLHKSNTPMPANS